MAQDLFVALYPGDKLLSFMARLETLGIKVREVLVEGHRTMELVDRNGAIILSCVVRLRRIDQLREIQGIFEGALQLDQTRH